jgi:hypothetical protein
MKGRCLGRGVGVCYVAAQIESRTTPTCCEDIENVNVYLIQCWNVEGVSES